MTMTQSPPIPYFDILTLDNRNLTGNEGGAVFSVGERDGNLRFIIIGIENVDQDLSGGGGGLIPTILRHHSENVLRLLFVV